MDQLTSYSNFPVAKRVDALRKRARWHHGMATRCIKRGLYRDADAHTMLAQMDADEAASLEMC